jgi:hypothetical protein
MRALAHADKVRRDCANSNRTDVSRQLINPRDYTCDNKIKDFSRVFSTRSHRIIRRARARVDSRGRSIEIGDAYRDTRRCAATNSPVNPFVIRSRMRFVSEQNYEIIIDRILEAVKRCAAAIAERFRLVFRFRNVRAIRLYICVYIEMTEPRNTLARRYLFAPQK